MADKIFLGKLSEKVFSNGGTIIKMSLNAEDRTTIAKNVNNGGYVNINIQKSKKGTYYAEIDQWQPTGQAKTEITSPAGAGPVDDLPF